MNLHRKLLNFETIRDSISKYLFTHLSDNGEALAITNTVLPYDIDIDPARATAAADNGAGAKHRQTKDHAGIRLLPQQPNGPCR
jgi:hypothetical protein